jgi:hypothetical protein
VNVAIRLLSGFNTISEDTMKVAKIVSPFGLSAVLFILAYLSSLDERSGIFPLMLMAIGIILTIVGIAVVFSNKDR